MCIRSWSWNLVDIASRLLKSEKCHKYNSIPKNNVVWVLVQCAKMDGLIRSWVNESREQYFIKSPRVQINANDIRILSDNLKHPNSLFYDVTLPIALCSSVHVLGNSAGKSLSPTILGLLNFYFDNVDRCQSKCYISSCLIFTAYSRRKVL